MTFGEEIKYARKTLLLTQAEMGKELCFGTTRNMTFCDEFLVTSELFVISTFHFMKISMRWVT